MLPRLLHARFETGAPTSRSPPARRSQPPARRPQVDNGRVYCLPDMYEVQDRSLADIQYVLSPSFTGGGDDSSLLAHTPALHGWQLSTRCGRRPTLTGPAAAALLRPLLPAPQQPRRSPSWTAACGGHARSTAASTCLAW